MTQALRHVLNRLASAIPQLFGQRPRRGYLPSSVGNRSPRPGLELLDDRLTPSTLISELPYVISVPGTYQLASDLYYGETTGSAISVQATGVIIDLSGHKLWSDAGPTTMATGIDSSQQSNITVQNGTIAGFLFGIRLWGETDSGNQVHDMHLTNNLYFGIWVDGSDSVVANNRVENTGGTNLPDYTIPVGIHVAGPDSTVANNRVTGFVWTEGLTKEVVGLALDDAPDTRVTGNIFAQKTYSANSWGLWVNSINDDGSTTIALTSNEIVNFQYGSGLDYAEAQAANNHYLNVPVPWIGAGQDAEEDLGGNVDTSVSVPWMSRHTAMTDFLNFHLAMASVGGQPKDFSGRQHGGRILGLTAAESLANTSSDLTLAPDEPVSAVAGENTSIAIAPNFTEATDESLPPPIQVPPTEAPPPARNDQEAVGSNAGITPGHPGHPRPLLTFKKTSRLPIKKTKKQPRLQIQTPPMSHSPVQPTWAAEEASSPWPWITFCPPACNN